MVSTDSSTTGAWNGTRIRFSNTTVTRAQVVNGVDVDVWDVTHDWQKTGMHGWKRSKQTTRRRHANPTD